MTGSRNQEYDPFLRGRFSVGERTIQAWDAQRKREFPCDLWYPKGVAAEAAGNFPLVVFSHSSGGRRRQSTFLCNHLSSHGYVVAAMDHSETVATELAPKKDETAEQKAARVEGLISNRVPDIRFLLDHLLDGPFLGSETRVDPTKIGVAGHSFGGWTALAATEADPRIRAVVALAPGGSSQTKPGILPLKLTFAWGRDVPTLYLVAEDDVSLPLAGMYELFERTPARKQMVVLRRADHLHFMDDVEQKHEAVRAMAFTGELAWVPREMRPFAELCSGDQAHVFTRGLTVCHFDAFLQGRVDAQRFLASDMESELAKRGVDAIAQQP